MDNPREFNPDSFWSQSFDTLLEFGVQPRSTSEEPTAFLGSTDEISVAVFTKPSEPVKEASHQPAQGSSIRVRLLTKGCRQNLVDAALARVPREGLRHVKYYIKALSMLEMKGVEADKAMNFLVDSHLSDKQVVFNLFFYSFIS
ncbi:unnamed protein product [Nippostrongylus brasiliensis]|uniref:Vps16_C domain-containing protein n=1 Tax=Nippostrongylus brasiliensis TaxID=27835 RepID=A0A0N4XL33_NIPBR|nr:unnamed protein product [Nippostrongylus brasiliensis]